MELVPFDLKCMPRTTVTSQASLDETGLALSIISSNMLASTNLASLITGAGISNLAAQEQDRRRISLDKSRALSHSCAVDHGSAEQTRSRTTSSFNIRARDNGCVAGCGHEEDFGVWFLTFDRGELQPLGFVAIAREVHGSHRGTSDCVWDVELNELASRAASGRRARRRRIH
ncbi:hypothetical protein E2562_005241 [Oryza meyeriana var. granulata]|uniref:Uncharacterized protein n=1 Tax=Oryza meyeriana var. granulata TaxID=110450 RepID=A0A6G1EEU8_9ORYZ|nr:hypothetical protein E2562_005241 [Oryza meyeriana var. granulata]